MSTHFKIIEGDNWKQYPIDKIIEDYLHSKLKVHEIQAKYNIHKNQWNRILRYFQSQQIPLRRGKQKHLPKTTNPHKYCHRTNTGKYRVRRRIKGKRKDYGTYNTLREAQDRVKQLEVSEWEHDHDLT